MDRPQGEEGWLRQTIRQRNKRHLKKWGIYSSGKQRGVVGSQMLTFRGNLSVSLFKGQQCMKNSFFDCLTFGTNHQPSPRNIAEERRTQLLRSGSLTPAYYKMLHKNRGLWISYRRLVIVSHPDKHSCLHGSFVNAVGIWDYTASHAKTVKMNWKGSWKKWSWHGETEKNENHQTSFPTDIRTGHLQNTALKVYISSHIAWLCPWRPSRLTHVLAIYSR